MEVDLFGRLKRVLNGLFAENETGIRHRALLFIFGYSFLILLLFSVVSVAILLSSLKEEGSRQIDSYEKLFTAYVTQDVLVGRYDELFRKCRESFENTRVSRLLMENPSGVKICDFGAENHVSSSAVREALVHFDEEKHFPAMRIQLGFDSLVPQRLVNRSAILILTFGLFLFVLSFAVSRVVVRRFFSPA